MAEVEVILGNACGSIAEDVCRAAAAAQIRPILIVLTVLVFILMVFQMIAFATKVKKPFSKSTFWVSIVLFDSLILIVLLFAIFALPWLNKIFGVMT